MTFLAVAGAVVLAFGAWIALFGRSRGDIWRRSWGVAAALIAYSVVTLGLLGRLDDVVGPVGLREIAVGIGVGAAWLVVTHLGHAILCRVLPSFVEQVRDLYGLGADDPASRVIGPLLAMAVAEELLFRGVVHGVGGIVTGVVVYTAVQAVERKWALVLAAFLGGIVWGGLFELTGGLLAPVVAHALWTVSLTLVWPLRGCDHEPTGTTPDRHVRDDGSEPIRSEGGYPSKHPQSKGRHA